MIRCDALVVGGGPAGSTCARLLHRAGWNVVVADSARFPRDKVCAGWLTPQVFPLLELDPSEYRAARLTLQEITAFQTSVLGGPAIRTQYDGVVSYAIRRCEFDHFLLARSGARVVETAVRTLRRASGTWIVNDEIEAPVVVGAGGHFCPVARYMRGGVHLRPVVAREAEFHLNGSGPGGAADAPELFFCHDMEGYAWCVRKGDYLNVGIGRRDGRDFNRHVREFMMFLESRGIAANPAPVSWRGHAYLAAGAGPGPLVSDGMLLAGDAAGVAYPESGEGIKPAIESGRLAAETLASSARWSAAELAGYTAALQRMHPRVTASRPVMRAALAALGRRLLGSRAFTRYVVLDRWFLRKYA